MRTGPPERSGRWQCRADRSGAERPGAAVVSTVAGCLGNASCRGWREVQTSTSDLPTVQQAVREVHGVVHARVTWPDPRGPAHLEIALDPGTDGPETVRSILSVLERAGGVDLDTLDIAQAERSAEPSPGRPVFVGLGVDRGELDTAIEITLEIDGRPVTGRAEGLASYQQSTRTTAAATLAALRQVLPPGVRVQLEWLEIIEPHGQRPGVVQVAVTTLTASSEVVDIGSAFIRGDVRESTVRATLDAVNRRLGALMVGEWGAQR